MMLVTLDHPLAAHLLTSLRDKYTEPAEFRQLCRRLTTILTLEATRGLPTEAADVQTPLEGARSAVLAGPIAAVPILRAGLGMLVSVTDLFPEVAVGYVGLERDERTAVARGYYCKLPKLDGMFTLLLDPMLATGGSARQAVDLIKAAGANAIQMITMVAAPEGVESLLHAHPDVRIVTAALDRCLNAKKYILPGLGDFGDRLYGTG